MKKTCALAALSVVMLCGAAHGAQPPKTPLPVETLTIADPAGKNVHALKVEIATTPGDQEYGLMNRKSLPANTGMLFVFPTADEVSFWMKDTLIPLDMLFIAADGHVGHIHADARPQDLTSIPSGGPVKAVLEIAGGEAAKLGIREGDIVRDRTFKTR